MITITPEVVGREEWRSVPGFPQYEINSLGRVKNAVRGRLLKVSIDDKGYSIVSLYRSNVKRKFQISRLLLTVFVGNPPTPEHEAAHLNGDSQDNDLQNLIWATRQENEDHKKIHGTRPIGEKHGLSKMTSRDIREVREQWNIGLSSRTLGRQYGVDKSTILHIVHGRTWAHVDS